MADRPTIEFFEYSIDQLCELFRIVVGASRLAPDDKLHLVYFRDYFQHFTERNGRLTIVVEWKYTDRDFLEDYAAYYVRCFEGKYLSVCARFHFFIGSLNESAFRKIDSDSGNSVERDLQEKYLGFIVVKRLPRTFIGRTCLRTYAPEERRFYPVRRKCKAHLLGLNLSVDSLAFQEQDSIAAACATSALWSALHGTAVLFQHKVFSPVEITRIATEQFPDLRRAFPNTGLNLLQMAAAIRTAGLEPEVIGVERKPTLQATVYAYLNAKIPLVLNAALFDCSDIANPKPYRDWDTGHAVTVAGYSLGLTEMRSWPGTHLNLRALRIDKLYVHDDQVGPFARLEFDGPALDVKYEGRDKSVSLTMKSSWRGRSGQIGTVYFAPEALIIPVYHKIRISFDDVLKRVLLRHDPQLRDQTWLGEVPNERLEWDIYLTSESDLKRELRERKLVEEDPVWLLLNTPLPRFIWRATLYLGGHPCLDLLFDATDISNGGYGAEDDPLLIHVLGYPLPEVAFGV